MDRKQRSEFRKDALIGAGGTVLGLAGAGISAYYSITKA